jgi:hypothetical protein
MMKNESSYVSRPIYYERYAISRIKGSEFLLER